MICIQCTCLSRQWGAFPYSIRGSLSLQNLVAISQRYYRPVLISKAGCKGNNGKNWLLNPGASSQSEGNSSKWLIWLVCRESLILLYVHQMVRPVDNLITLLGYILYSEAKIAVLRSLDKFVCIVMYFTVQWLEDHRHNHSRSWQFSRHGLIALGYRKRLFVIIHPLQIIWLVD